MFLITALEILLYALFYIGITADIEDYYAKRAEITRTEFQLVLGENNTLTDKETNVNICLMQHKFEEVDYAFDNPQYFNYSHHYFLYKDRMRRTKLYKMIKEMPKGAALHLHDKALMGPDYLMNITYMDYLYFCYDKESLFMKFSDNVPDKNCDWQLMTEARNQANVAEFDKQLRKHFTLVVDNPEVVYPSITETWSAFTKYFTTVSQILQYKPVWEQYIYNALKRFRDDNIMYVEVRSNLSPLYELNGTVYDQNITAKVYKNIITKFVEDYPDFIGAKVIFAPSRYINRTTLEENLMLARKIKNIMPDIFAGFDLVGQEDLGMPLIEFVPQLLAASSEFNYFFHAGETNWYGTTSDENLIDAVLLGSKRIGHAYALIKHPIVMQEVKEKNIGLEINLISNTVLSLVRDVRNHPLSVFLANGLPVVLSSDDPGAWEAEPLTDDFYVAFVGASSRLADLRMLKKLAKDSLKYSVLGIYEKAKALEKFEVRWSKFVEDFDCTRF